MTSIKVMWRRRNILDQAFESLPSGRITVDYPFRRALLCKER